MVILGIETSCDETAAAVVKDGTTVLSNVLASSAKLHALTGGVIPEEAARKQIKSIIPVIEKALQDAFGDVDLKSQLACIDAFAVTVGPGLIGSLLVGVETAKTLSFLWNKPLIPTNHLVAHIYANWIIESDPLQITKSKNAHKQLFPVINQIPKFPALALVVSGGHTDLVLMHDHGNLEWISGTRDDAAGEAFDKTARLLGLDYPGGPLLARSADKFIKKNPGLILNMFPRPMMDHESLDWSFSGLKTSALNKVKNIYQDNYPNHKNVTLSDYRRTSRAPKVKKNLPRIAAEIQEAIVEVLVEKSTLAVKKYQPKSFLISGGVAANQRLRESFSFTFKECKMKVEFHVPAIRYCTDNAAVIASCANYNSTPVAWKNVSAKPQMEIVSNRVTWHA